MAQDHRPAQISGLGVDAAKLAELGAYLTSLPYENYATGVSGYNASNKAVIVIKDGWIVGEYYNQPSAVHRRVLSGLQRQDFQPCCCSGGWRVTTRSWGST